MPARRQLGRILLSHGVISEAQVTEGLEYQKRQGCRLGEALIALNLCGELEVARALAEQNDIPFVDLEQTPPAAAAIRLVPREVAVQYGIIPVVVEGNRLLVAATNPYDLRIDDVVRRTANMGVIVGCAAGSQVRDLLGRYEELKWGQMARPGMPQPARPSLAVPSASPGVLSPVNVIAGLSQPAQPDLSLVVEQPAIVLQVNSLIAEAVRKRATEIHFEPDGEELRVGCRIDGCLHPLTRVPPQQAGDVMARLLAMSGLRPGNASASMPRTCPVRVDGKSIELRPVVLPGAEREILILRVVNPDSAVLSLDGLGLERDMLERLRRLLADRQGLILVTGPTRAGRSTTLYALLDHLRANGRHVYAAEATFERKLTGITRVKLGDGPDQPITALLERCLQQNPEVLMVGELPDKASAEIACRAAATGQVLLSGSFAPSSVATVTRLLDMGVAAHEVGAAVSGVLAQRLVRRVCEECAAPYRLPFELDRALRTRFAWPEEVHFRRGTGCPRCHSIGSFGCVGVFELLVVDPDFRSLLSEKAPPTILYEHLSGYGYRTLEEDAFRKACFGLIAPEEIVRLGLDVAAVLEQMGVKGAAYGEDTPLDALVSWGEWSSGPPADIPNLETWGDVASLAQQLN
jgi:type IV pilus assembly protein PilB